MIVERRLVLVGAESKTLTMAFSTRAEGDMTRTNSRRIEATRARARFMAAAGLSFDRVALVRATHSPNFEVMDLSQDTITRRTYLRSPRIDADYSWYRDGSDGILTANLRVPVGLVSGDCIPLMVWDSESALHGILHVGLLGVLNGMATGLRRLFDEGMAEPSTLHCYLGPAIRADHYNVSRSGLWRAIRHQAVERVPELSTYLVLRDSEEYVDLQAATVRQLEGIGIPAANIEVHPLSTADTNSPFFSHSAAVDRFDTTPRFMSVIGYE